MVKEKTMNIIEQIEKEEIARLTANKTIPFAPGDTVIVNVNVVEGTASACRLRRRGDRQA
jgi:large subunit ribosomal protein L19